MFPKAEVCVPATEEPVALTCVAEQLQKPLLSCTIYSRWFEILGFLGSLPQLILPWPWVALGLRRLQEAQAAARALPAWVVAGRALRCWSNSLLVPQNLLRLSHGWVGASSGFC